MTSSTSDRGKNSGAKLSPQHFFILASLSEGPKHGYAISQQIQNITEGTIALAPRTLYGNIHALQERGFIRLEDAQLDPANYRRIVYRITEVGIAALDQHWKTLQAVGDLITQDQDHETQTRS